MMRKMVQDLEKCRLGSERGREHEREGDAHLHIVVKYCDTQKVIKDNLSMKWLISFVSKMTISLNICTI